MPIVEAVSCSLEGAVTKAAPRLGGDALRDRKMHPNPGPFAACPCSPQYVNKAGVAAFNFTLVFSLLFSVRFLWKCKEAL